MPDYAAFLATGDKIPVRQVLLEKAQTVTAQDRNLKYGNPDINFQRIANLWNVYLTGRSVGPLAPIEPWETAIMMVLLKVARIMHDPNDPDHFVDIAGYAATAGEAYAIHHGEDNA